MAIRLDNSFVLDMPPDQAWAFLNDVERVALFVPGARLTEVEGDTFHGTVSVKLGPITAQYKGAATITARDTAAKRLTLTGKGKDVRGQGTAGADLVANVVPEGTGSRINVATDIQVTGKVAQLGRGVMQDVSARLIDQFVANFKAAGETAAPTAPAPPADNGASAPSPATDTPSAAPDRRTISAPEPQPIDLVGVGGAAFLGSDLFVGLWRIAVLILLVIIALRHF